MKSHQNQTPSVMDKDSIVTLYRNNGSAYRVAKLLDLHHRSVIRVLRSVGFDTSIKKFERQHVVDETCFDVLTEEALYFLGLIATDGCVSNKKYGATHIELQLQKRDLLLVERFKQFLKTDYPIRVDNKKNSVHIQVGSDVLAEKLAKFGIVPRKTAILEIIDHRLLQSRHFWRGAIDGDGSLGWYSPNHKWKYPAIHLVSASRSFAEQFRQFLMVNIDYNRKVMECNNSTGGYFKVSVLGKKAETIISLLYTDCTVYLERKLERSKILLEGVNYG